MTNFDAVIADLKWIISIHETADFAPIDEIERAIKVLRAAPQAKRKRVARKLRPPLGHPEQGRNARRKGEVR